MTDFSFLLQVFVAIAANGGAFIFGILLGWSAPTAPNIIEQDDYYFWVTSNQFSWIVALMALGGALSCILSGILRSKVGTRMTILLFLIPIVVGWALIMIPLNPAMLMFGRFLCGVSAGCYSYILPVYVGEISSNQIRGVLLGLFQLSVCLGVLFVFTVGHFASLLVLHIVCGSITIIYSLGFLLLPESPAILISKNRVEDAGKSLKALRGKSYNPLLEIEVLQQQKNELEGEKKSFSEVLQTKSTKKAFIIILFQFLFFQMSGINVVLFYSTIIFIEAGIGLEPGIASIVIAGVQALSNLIALVFVDSFGRKIMLSFSNSFMCIGLIGIGTYFTLKDASVDVHSIDWLPVASLCIFVIAFSMGMGPISYVLLGEIFLQEAKAYVAPIGQVMNFMLTFVIGLTFPMLTDTIGTGPTFFIFSAFCIIALIFTICVIPETKGKTLSEIQLLLSN